VKLEAHLGVEIPGPAVRACDFKAKGLQAHFAADDFKEVQDEAPGSPSTMGLKNEQLVQESILAGEFEAVAQRQDRIADIG